MAALATEAQLAGWLGIAEADLPDDVGRLLERASELIRHAVTLPDVFDDDGQPNDADHAEPLADATCAQVELWIEVGEDRDVDGPVQSFQLGDLQVAYGAGPNREPARQLAPRARRQLFDAGLLARGVMIG